MALVFSLQGSGSHIPLEEAEKFIGRYIGQATNRFGSNSEGQVNVAISFDMESLNRVLQQDECEGLRLYFGLEPESDQLSESLTIVVIGIDKEGNDIGFDPQTLEPKFTIEAEERGTKSKSILPNPTTNNNRAFLLERILRT